MIRLCLMLLAVLLSVPGVAATPDTEPALVLVANAQSTITRLAPETVRKLYLGVPLMVDNQRIHPLRNGTNTMLHEKFMQKVMFMSTPAYERQILSRVFRLGGQRPPVYTDWAELVRALESDPTAVTYAQRELAVARRSLKIVGEF